MERRNLIGSLVLIIIFAAILGTSAFTFAQAKGGFDDPSTLNQFNVYLNVGIWGLIGIIAIMFFEFLISKGDSEYGDGIGFFSLGEIPHIKFFENYTALQITWASLIFFLILGLGNILLIDQIGFLQESYSGVGFITQQQFTPGESALFSTILAPTSEKIAILFVIALTVFTIRILARKFDLGEFNFIILSIFAVVIVSFITGLLWHTTVYPESDFLRFIGASFWAIGGLITVLIGLITPFLMMHYVNNGIFYLKAFFSNDTILTMLFFAIFLLIIGYIFVYRERSITGSHS